MKHLLLGFLLFAFSLLNAQRWPDFATMKDTTELNLAGMNIDTLPAYISSCVHLKKINLSGNGKIKVLDTFKKLSKLPALEELNMDYCNLFFLPSFIADFKALKRLSLEGNGIEYLPVSFKNLGLEELNISVNRIDSLNAGFYSLKKLKTLDFSKNEGVGREYNMEILATLPTLQMLVLTELTDPPKGIGKLKNLEVLIISEGKFKALPNEIAQLTKLRSLDISDCSLLDLSVAIESIASLKQLTSLHCGHVKLSVIPFNISKLKALRSLTISYAELGRLPVSFKDLSLMTITFDEVSFSDKNEFFAELNKMNSLRLIYLRNCGIRENEISSKKQVVFQEKKKEERKKVNSFNEVAKNHRAEMPIIEYELLTSKVILTIKKQVAKNKFYFTLEPQYGYTEKYLDLFGDKIKAYPELKVYKGIHWEYTGTAMDADLLKMYALSEKTNKEKAKKKTTVEIYVLNLQDIIIYPEKEEDTYVMGFSRGFDTLKIKTLPELPLMDAKKVQKWHKTKYESYMQQRQKREEKWALLDKKYLLVCEKYEQKLEAYRNKLIVDYYNEIEK
ncbi:MAG: leucine-rich repeat domain-containing protein [Flavobacteriales bacterium]